MRRPWWRAVLVALMLATTACFMFENPGTGRIFFSQSETLRPSSTPEVLEGPLGRRLTLSIPPGAMEGATAMVRKVRADLQGGRDDPRSPFEIRVGEPINEVLSVERDDPYSWDWEVPWPPGCEAGCEFTIDFVIEHTGDSPDPAITWGTSVSAGWPKGIPEIADHITGEVIPFDPQET